MQYDNVSVELEVLDFPAALAKQAQRSFQMLPAGIIFAEPTVTLYTNLHSGSSSNVTGADDPQLDAALEAALAAPDEESRTEALQQVAEAWNEVVPQALYYRINYGLVYSDRLRGVQMCGVGSVRTDTLWVAG